MSHPSSTPVKVPASAATYTPATLDPDLRSQINTVLLREGYITKIQEQLLHSLDAHPSNWPSAVQTHALTLLRSGEASTFPALIRRVLEDVRHDTATARAAEASGGGGGGGSSTTTATTATTSNNNGTSTNANTDGGGGTSSSSTTDANSDTTAKNGEGGGGSSSANGASAAVVVNGNKKTGGGAGATVNGVSGSGGVGGDNGLAVPAAVLETVLKLARESLEAVCQLEDTPATTNGG